MLGGVNRWIVILLCLLGGAALRADDLALVGVGEPWRYQLGTLEPSGPPGAWTRDGYDDAGWLIGESGFGYSPSGYGENTPLTDGSGLFISTYFRKSFQVENPSRLRFLTLRVDWQGGFVAFLNGRELLRVNLTNGPAGFVPFDQRAGYRDPNGAVDIDLSAALPLLKAGTNLLAFQLHSANSTAYSLVFVPELLGNFTRGPLTRNITSERATVLWDTPAPTLGRLEYGPTPALGASLTGRASELHHQFDLTNLPAGQTVYYRAGIQSGADWITSPTYSLRTLPSTGSTKWIVLGDSGAGTAGQFAVARMIAPRNPDVIVHLGDVVYPSFTFPYSDTRCLSVYREALRSIPYYFVWGNHDLYAGEDPFIRTLMPPTNSTPPAQHLIDHTRPEFYYSFDAGDVHVAMLFQPYASQYLINTNSPQLKWLEADLLQSKKPWKWIALHHPLNTSGLHRPDDRNLDGLLDRVQIGSILYPLARRTGVQLVLAGHDHSYERLRPTNGVHHVVTGGGGSILYPMWERDPGSAHFESRHHLVEIEVQSDVLRVKAVGTNGVVFDTTEFRRTDPASEDPDGDGLSTATELALGTNPNDPDTDGDGLPDGWEWMNGSNPLSAEGADGAEAAGPGGRLPNRVRFLAEPPNSAVVQLAGIPARGGAITLRWMGRPDAMVRLESSLNPEGPYAAVTEFGADRGAGSGLQSLTLPASRSAHFFRMRVLP